MDKNNVEQHLGYQIGVLSHLLQNQYNKLLAKYDVTVAQAKVLFLLVKYGPQLQGDLQQRLYIKASTMNGIIDSLLNKKLIEKEVSIDDRRSKVISLTEQGRLIDKQLWKQMENHEQQVFDGFASEEIALMRLWLSKMISNMVDNEKKEGN